MGTCCIKNQETDDSLQMPVDQIDFHALLIQKLIGPTGNFIDLLKFLTQQDVVSLSYLIKALFHESLKKKISNFASKIRNRIENFKPPERLVKLAQINENKKSKRDSIEKQIVQKESLYKNKQPQKSVEQVFSVSSCPILKSQKDYYHTNLNIEEIIDTKQKQRQIQERLQKLSQALKGAENAYQIQRSFVNRQSHSRLNDFSSQGYSSFLSKVGSNSPTNKKMAITKDGIEKIFKTSFQSVSPENRRLSQKSLQQKQITLKKTNTLKDSRNQKIESIELRSNYSKLSKKSKEKTEEYALVDKYQEIKQFYEKQITKYRQELQNLRNQLVIWQKEKQSSVSYSIFSSLLSKQSKQSIVSNAKKAQTMKICSAEVNQQIKQKVSQAIEYGSKMSIVDQSNSESQQNSQFNDDSHRKHAKSIIIRLFRDSKMFPIEYSKKSSPVRFVLIRQKIENLFISFYTEEIYQRNPIERTNMIFFFEEKQPKRYYDYLKDYKSWLLIGQVDQNLYIGAYVNLKKGPKTSTVESFLFSMQKQGKPYILRAKKNIIDPMTRPQYINFGDSEFRIKSGTKNVSLSLENINMSFQEQDGNDPNTRRFSLKYGENIQLQRLQIHEIVFSQVCQ